MGQLSFNPYLTTNAQNTFILESTGYIQGTALDDPSVRNQLSGGPIASTEALPMWGGIPIEVDIPPLVSTPQNALGSNLKRATNQSLITGWTVFNQVHSAINSPQSPVPLAASGMQMNFYGIRSLARIAVPVAPALVSLSGSPINSQVSWDFVNGQLNTYQPAYLANVLTAQSYSSSAGGTFTYTTTSAHGLLPGSSFTISGSVPAGYNGTFIAAAGTTGSTIVATGVGANPGASVTLGTLAAGGGALPVNILNIAASNCMTVQYNAVTGFATWNYNGALAIIQI